LLILGVGGKIIAPLIRSLPIVSTRGDTMDGGFRLCDSLSFPSRPATMFERRSLRTPITLGVVMILLVVGLIAVWVVQNVLGATGNLESAAIFWIMLLTGTVLLTAVLAGVIAYLTLTVKAFNLNRRQSNFIDAVTHELKSPIASLKLYLQTMAIRTVDEAQARDFHRFMLEDVERLDTLINHLLDAARIDSDRLSKTEVAPDNEVVELDQLLRQCATAVCNRYRVAADTVRIEAVPITVQGQWVQLEILFRNLIDNAVKYGGSPPQVELTVSERQGTDVLVCISDNGPGIPANHRRKIFGRFVRLGNELERKTPGTGLGLYLVRNVVKSMGGSIRIHSRENTVGTIFQVILPGVVRASAHSSG
jgi:signal transduction histidine kinase